MTAAAEKRTRGRPLKGTAPLDARVEVRLTTAQRDKLARLGGVDWLRARINRARLPGM